MDVKDNAYRAKTDADYLGDVIVANENLIWHSCHKYVGNPDKLALYNGLEKDDILQLGRLGFIKAVNAFDPDRGIRFSSFAVITMVREIRCFLRDSSSIIRPTRSAYNLKIQIDKLVDDLGMTPTPEEIADLLDESVDKVNKVLILSDTPFYIDGSERPLDLIDCSTDLEREVLDDTYLQDVINSLLPQLSEVEQAVLHLRLDGYSQTQVAKRLNISQMRVCRAIKKVATILRHNEKLKTTES